MRREGQVRVTTTGGLRIDGVRAGLDTAPRAGVSQLRSTLAGLASSPAPPDTTSPDAAPAATPSRGLNRPECRVARAALHDYLHARLVPSRRRRVEAHLDGCDECTRAFIDVREVSWALRGLGRRLVTDGHHGGRHRAPRSRTGTATA